MLAILFANGEFVPPPDLDQRLAAAQLLVAADGGGRHCLRLGLAPQLLVGDMDSLSLAEQAELQARGAKLLRYPADKDQTDLELALAAAREAGVNEIIVLAGLGGRWDHSLANLLLAAQAQFADLPIVFLHGGQRLFTIRAAAELDAKPGERVSLLPLAGDAEGVRTQGLTYPLAGETLPLGSSRGVSNVVAEPNPRVELARGILLCIIQHRS
ncbi:MAG: thiamine diphosphokinase [Anaerolineales bacterium]|nr:thiamine diphosphokinase [Anaerolineales bacterium]